MTTNPVDNYFEYSPEVRIRYRITGNGGRTMLMLHGFAASLETWKDLEPLIRHRWQLVQVDLKGFGLSSKPRDRAYTIVEQAGIVAALARHLRLNDYVLVGHSYGGTVAMTTCQTSGQEGAIRSLVLIDAPCYPQKLPFSITVLRIPLLSRVLLSVTPPRILATYMLHDLFTDKKRITAERINQYARYFALSGSREAMIMAARQIVPADPGMLTERIPAVAVPTLIVWGEKDALILPWQAARLYREIKGAQLAILRDCGHVPHEERPEEVARLLADFVG